MAFLTRQYYFGIRSITFREFANFIFSRPRKTREPAKNVREAPLITAETHTNQVDLKDGLIRLIGIPFFGIAIPNITGLFGDLTWRDPWYWIGYVYFMTLAALIWQGNRHLLFRTRKRFTWFDKPVEKLVLLIVNNIFYTSPLTIAMLCVWYRLAGFAKVEWDVVYVVVLINVICVLFVTHVYETVFMLKEQQNEQLRNADLQRAKAEAELTALRNQVDPHFMFNSLNSLSYLITSDREKASRFTDSLAEVYRYILSQKDQSMVLLEDELAFTSRYTALLHLRFGNAVKFISSLPETAGNAFLIPPMSVFIALENAVKHNEITATNPLEVAIALNGDALTVSNILRPKRNVGNSSGIGLRNLNERYQLITGKPVNFGPKNGTFEVNLPLIPLTS